MKRYILQGNERSVAKIVRENRIRVGRGEVEFIPSNEENTDEGFVDDDVNGFENVHGTKGAETTTIEDEVFDDVSDQPSEAVQKILLEPLGKENTSEESTTVTDNVEAEVVEPIADSKEVSVSDTTGTLESDSKNVEVEESKDSVPEDSKELGTENKKSKGKKSKSE